MPTHERDIPNITSINGPTVKVEECCTELSFTVATSLAVAKRLTWEQTPWLNPELSVHQCTQIAEYVGLATGKDIPWQCFCNAFLLGETYVKGSHDDSLATFPQLLVVFPHVRRVIETDQHFLRLWHDEIVRPAFDRAWEDSSLVEVYGANKDFMARINLPFSGPVHGKEAHPAEGLLHHLRNGSTKRVRTHWPEWNDFWGPGHEGKHSGMRAKIFNDAWKSITGMLKDHPEMREFQDPMLLLVNRGRTDLNPVLGLQQIYKASGEFWDRFVDGRYVLPGSFQIVIQTVLGNSNGPQEEADMENEGVERKKIRLTT